MAYKKPEVLAKNQPSGSYAAGCPAQDKHKMSCRNCEMNQ